MAFVQPYWRTYCFGTHCILHTFCSRAACQHSSGHAADAREVQALGYYSAWWFRSLWTRGHWGCWLTPLTTLFSLSAQSDNMQQSVKINLPMVKRYLLGRRLQATSCQFNLTPSCNKLETSVSALKTSISSWSVNFIWKKCLSCPFLQFYFCCCFSFQTFVIPYGDSCWKLLTPAIPSFGLCAALNHSLNLNTTSGKPSVAAHRVKSKCRSMIFKALTNVGHLFLSDFLLGCCHHPVLQVMLGMSPVPCYVMRLHAPVTLFSPFPPPALLSPSPPLSSGGNPFILWDAIKRNGSCTNSLPNMISTAMTDQPRISSRWKLRKWNQPTEIYPESSFMDSLV